MVTVPTFTDGSGGGREMGEIVWDPARRRVAGTTILYNTRMCTYTPVKRHVWSGLVECRNVLESVESHHRNHLIQHVRNRGSADDRICCAT